MKKSYILILFVVIILFITGCFNASVRLANQDNEREHAIIHGLPVTLKSNVSASDFDQSIDDIVSDISSTIVKSRGVSNDDELIVIDSSIVSESINSTLDEYDFPDFNVEEDCDIFPESEINKIRDDFPSLSDEEIANNFEIIQDIYDDQLSILTKKKVIEEITTSNDSDSIRSISKHRSAYDNIKKLKNITKHEIAACIKHPLSALSLLSQREKAFSLTEEAMHVSDQFVNIKPDAFRHAAWNIVMAKYAVGRKNNRLAWANDFSTAHEKGKKYIKYDAEMDLHNNKIGRDYYDYKTDRKYVKFFCWKIEVGVKNEPSDANIKKDIKAMANSATFVSKDLPLGKYKKLVNKASGLVYIEEDNKVY